MFYYLIGVFVILLVIFDRWKPKQFVKIHEQIGCNFVYMPIFGHINLLLSSERRIKTYLDLARQSYKNKHGMTSVWLVNQLVVEISDPLQAKYVLKSCLGKGALDKIMSDALCSSSAFAPVDIWQRRRKVMVAILGPKYAKKFANIISKHSEDLCDKLTCQVSKGDFSIWQYIYSYSLDVIVESATGNDIKIKNQLHHPFFDAIEKSMENSLMRACQPWLLNDTVYKFTPSYKIQEKLKTTMMNFGNELISNRKVNNTKQSSPETEIGDKTLFELMIEISGNDNGYSENELLEELLLLLIASTDTTATSIGFICLVLSLYPEVQNKIYDEIKQILGESNRSLKKEVEKLKYLEAVIKEVLRLYPPGPVIYRHCCKDLQLPSGITLKKGLDLIINIIGINRNPHYWGEDAEVFRPERFLEEEPRHPAAFMSFSYGPRNCAGQHFSAISLRVILSTLIRRFRIKPATSYSNEKEVQVRSYIMLRPVNDFKIQLENRK